MTNLPVEVSSGEVVPLNPEIERALIDGHKIHGFSSGGGLRVIRIETEEGELVGYGEAPQVEEAIAHASLDYAFGHEPYEQQYSGDNSRHPHYLTGTQEISSPLDGHLRWGSTFDAVWSDGEVEVSLSGYANCGEVSAEIQEEIIATGKEVIFEERGITYKAVRGFFPGNGEANVTTSVVDNPEGRNAWMCRVVRLGTGLSLQAALAAAFEAPEIEEM